MVSLVPVIGFVLNAHVVQNAVLDVASSWSREAGALQVAKIDDRKVGAAVQIEHKGDRDWSISSAPRLKVSAGDRIEISAWLRCEGAGDIRLCAIAYSASDVVRDWALGEKVLSASPEWKFVRTRIVVPDGVGFLLPRVIGAGPSKCAISQFSVTRLSNVASLRAGNLPERLILDNGALQLSFYPKTLALSAALKGGSLIWSQGPAFGLVATKVKQSQKAIDVQAIDPASDRQVNLRIEIDPKLPECLFTIDAKGEMPSDLVYPQAFQTRKGEYLVIPMNEGISFPVDDASIEPMQLIAYGGHGICMPFWGQTDGNSGVMAILETPDDASISIDRREGLLGVCPVWEPQKGQYGYPRRVRYIFLDKGGHVAMCKRYRAYAKKSGLLVTLAEKRKRNPYVDKLIGAANIWNWDADPVEMGKELLRSGIDRILWSRGGNTAQIAALNGLGVLTSRYDIYQDVMDPAQYPKLQWIHGDWTEKGWPKDLMIGPNGDWIKGWEVETKDGKMIPCGVLCDRQAPRYAVDRIDKELKKIAYQARFIDTTTASPWRECYSPDHPLTRTESKKFKMDLLAVASRRFNLVTGCETGHDASVPFLHFFEGMMSLGPYRVPDAGRNMDRIWAEVPEAVSKFQLGHRYRLPLWELVYHDCTVSYWYWGDYNNKLPALWPKRDLFNALYGTPPMYMFTKALWTSERATFVKSYRTASETARLTGYSEMVDHRFLTPDRDVQQTVFSNGVTVTVNFGNKPYQLRGMPLDPMGVRIDREVPSR